GFVYFIDDGVYGSFSELLLSPEVHFQPIPLKKISDEVYPTCIWGQSCDGTDFVNKACNLPKDFGAYTSSVASNFNGFEASKYIYYYITMETWKKMKWTSEDFKVNIVFIDAEKALIAT
ncbi:Ornithine decarboxylase, partial [Exaiptasia diaphana]